jgi:hypothetical protein
MRSLGRGLTSDQRTSVERFDGQSIIYAFKEPVAAHAYTRVTYTPVSKTHFTWRGEKSNDANAWSEFMVIEAHRSSSD